MASRLIPFLIVSSNTTKAYKSTHNIVGVMSGKLSKEISIVIPTFNRPDFIRRLLHYYSEMKFEGAIHIGDSSEAGHLDETKRLVQTLQESLDIQYHLCLNMNEPKTSVALIKKVKTPYVTLLPDDDFLIPSGLIQCADFLEKNPGYSVAHGASIMIILEKSGPFGKLQSVGPYGGVRDVLHEKATDRLLDHLSDHFVLSFGVHRTSQMKEAYSRVAELADKGVAEILAACFSVLQGKIKALDCFYLVRQGHDQRYVLPDIYDWMMREDWFESYQIFFSELTEKLAKEDSLSKKEAAEVLKRAFWFHLAQGFSSRWQRRYVPNHSQRDAVKKVLKNVPGAKRLWEEVRSLLPNGRFLLPALLKNTSPYHNDFMPIFRSVSERPFLLP